MRATRRHLLGAAAAAGLAAPAAARASTATLLVPGPTDGTSMRWAYGLVRTLLNSAAAARIEAHALGGADGVTAANRFATVAAADGQTLLVLNGAAAQARLIGEPRARFDPAGWLPVCASVGTAMVVGARPMCGCERVVRVGLPGPAAAATVALLVLEQLGIAATPVFGLAGAEALAAMEAGRIDVAVLPGPDRFTPWFTLGTDPDPERGEAPAATTLIGDAPGTLRAAIRAAGIAAGLDGALVLPALTEADRLARWRLAAQRWVDAADGGAARRLDGPAAGVLLAAAMPPPAAMLAYREWLLRRLGWQPQ